MASLTRIALALVAVLTTVELAADEPPVPKPVKVEFFWGEGKPIAGLTQDKGVVWSETGDLLYWHKQPVLTNKDVVKVEVSKIVFGAGAFANEHFTVKFHLTKEARKRLAETCGPRGEKMLAAVVEGRSAGNPFYLKSRDETDFIPFAGGLTSKDLVDRIVATFAETAQDSKASKDSATQSKTPPAKPRIKVELHWAEFKQIPGVTDEKGFPFGEGDAAPYYLHKQAAISNEDIADARVGDQFEFAGQKLHNVNLFLTTEGTQKLEKTGASASVKYKLLAAVVDGRHNGSAGYVHFKELSRFSYMLGAYDKPHAEQLAASINAAAEKAREEKAASNVNKLAPITVENAKDVRRVAEIEKRVHRILLGPGRGEVSLVDNGLPAEVVDDVNLRPLRTLGEKPVAYDFTLSRDGRFAAWESGGRSYVVQELANGKTVEIKLENSPGFAGFSPDGQWLAIGDTFWEPKAEGEGVSKVKLFDRTGKLVRTLDSPGPGAITPVFSPDGKIIAVGNRNYQTLLYEVETGKLLHTLPRRMTHGIAFSPDGKLLAAGYVEGAVVIWDVSNGTERQSMQNVAAEIYTVDWSPKGDLLVTAGRGGKITLWDPTRMAALKELESPGWVISARFTSDGARLLTSGGADYGRADRKVVVWSIPDEIEK